MSDIHHTILTPLVMDKELPEHKAEILCTSTAALVQKMEQISQLVFAKYNDDKVGFKVECRECQSLYYFIDGIIYDRHHIPRKKEKPVSPYQYHLN